MNGNYYYYYYYYFFCWYYCYYTSYDDDYSAAKAEGRGGAMNLTCNGALMIVACAPVPLATSGTMHWQERPQGPCGFFAAIIVAQVLILSLLFQLHALASMSSQWTQDGSNWDEAPSDAWWYQQVDDARRQELHELKERTSALEHAVHGLADLVQKDNESIKGTMEQLLVKMNELVERSTGVEVVEAAAVKDPMDVVDSPPPLSAKPE